jgi:hypothetical protein
MNKRNLTKGLFSAAILLSGLFLYGCNPTKTTETNTDNTTNTTVSDEKDSNANSGNESSADNSENSAAVIEAKEPETYQAKINLKLEAVGENNNASMPEFSANFARSGDNKRMEFNLPNGQQIVYLEMGSKNLVILPEKKQYAEINKQSVGMDVRSMMTPEQIVQRAKGIPGLEKVGDEKYNGRDAVKYKYSNSTKTNTKAGDVDTESIVYIDKETGLPLKTEIVSQSKDGNVQGFKGIKIITEMSDIKTDVSADLFKEPEGFEKIDEQKIREQINLVFNAAGAILQQMIQNAN